jgi:hypothetical protein
VDLRAGLDDLHKIFVLVLQGTLRENSLKLKSSLFWDITPRNPLKINRRLEGTFCIRDGADVPPKRLLSFNGLYGVLFQKVELFITTGARTTKLSQVINPQLIIKMDPSHRSTEQNPNVRRDSVTAGRCRSLSYPC